MHTSHNSNLALRRVRFLVGLFIIGLVISGATAIPLNWEMQIISGWLPPPAPGAVGLRADLARWLYRVHLGLNDIEANYPFLAYGYDWLAFGHFMIALVFVGAWRDPARNIWLFDFGILACLAVIPFATIMGGIRGIPFGWRLIDCCFGIGANPMVCAALCQSDPVLLQHHALYYRPALTLVFCPIILI